MTTAGTMLALLLAGRQIFEGIILFWVLPLVLIRFFKPVSRSKMLWCMTAYIVVWLCFGVPKAIDHYGNLSILSSRFGRLAVYLFIFRDVVVPPVFGLLGCALLSITRRVDEKMPAEFKAAPAVYATVIATDDVTRVEYQGKIYVMAKEFAYETGDIVKVRILEGRNDCWIA